MSHGSRVCPSCGALNGASEQRCYRCGKRLPGPWSSSLKSLTQDVLGQEAPMTKAFWGICVLVFAACLATDGQFDLLGGFRSSTLLRFGMLFGPLLENEPWRLLSAVFVHAGILHIVFNSMALVDLGRMVEAEFGSARFAVLFVVTAVFGFVVSYYFQPLTPTVGASGGIFGLIGALTGIFLVRRDAVYRALVGRMLVYALIITIAIPRINIAAHLGGLVAGVALGYLFELERRRRFLDGLMWALAGVCLLASVASVFLSNRSTEWKDLRAHEAQGE